MNNYYVYVCYVDDIVRYVGKGKGNRYKHCVSGKSTCAELNKALFTGSELSVERVFMGLSEEQAFAWEQEVIDGIGLDNLYNKNNSKSADISLRTRSLNCIADFYQLLKEKDIVKVGELEAAVRLIDKKHNRPICSFVHKSTIRRLLPYYGFKQNGRQTMTYVRESNPELKEVMDIFKQKLTK